MLQRQLQPPPPLNIPLHLFKGSVLMRPWNQCYYEAYLYYNWQWRSSALRVIIIVVIATELFFTFVHFDIIYLVVLSVLGPRKALYGGEGGGGGQSTVDRRGAVAAWPGSDASGDLGSGKAWRAEPPKGSVAGSLPLLEDWRGVCHR